MEILSLFFRLGVILAIFSFIWGIIRIGIVLLRGGQMIPTLGKLMLRFTQYILIVDIVILFVSDGMRNYWLNAIGAGLLLIFYFLSKFQKQTNRISLVQIKFQLQKEEQPLTIWNEFWIMVIAICLYWILIFYPEFAFNPISKWFYDGVLNVESTFFFGFIFKVIGFFFSVHLILKAPQVLLSVLNGDLFKPAVAPSTENNVRDKDSNFDDYEEVN